MLHEQIEDFKRSKQQMDDKQFYLAQAHNELSVVAQKLKVLYLVLQEINIDNRKKTWN